MNLTIDGRAVTARAGETVLECALRHEMSIPHLCTHPDLKPFGACRMCLVEIEGMRGFPASCSTPATDGMVVSTETPQINELRRGILELILLEHPSACLVCDKQDLCEKYRPKAEKAGRTTGCHTCNNKEVCDVRVLSRELGVNSLPHAAFYRSLPIERSDPFIDRDMNLCILCGRCVRICKHHHETGIIDFVSRGSQTIIGTAFNRALIDADCRFCGACVDVCPTGSIASRYAKWHGAPDTITETTCQLCDEACAVKAYADRRRVVDIQAVDGGLPICVLGRFGVAPFHNSPDRLRVPKLRVGDRLREVQWKQALTALAEKLEPYRGETFAFICDDTSTLEDRYVFRQFTAEVMGSPHFIEARSDARGVSHAELPDGVKAAYLTGQLIDPQALAALEVLIVQDCYLEEGSRFAKRVDFVLPVAIFAEIDGTIVDGQGEHRPLHRAAWAPGKARFEWQIVSELAAAMGVEAFAWDSVAAVAQAAGIEAASPRAHRETAPPAALDPRVRRTHFRGHRIDGKARGLESLSRDNEAAGR